MTMDAFLVAAVLAAAMLPVLQAVDDGCLSCLCQAATGCDADRGCDGAVCGMFAISQQYWKDAGEPGGDFETCALDPACATQCVQAYLRRFAKDCDGDGGVGCPDYCRLHRLGREGCGGALDGAFAGRLDACNASIPLGDFYARSVARPVRQGARNQWNSGGGNGYSAAQQQQPAGGSPSYSFNPTLSLSVNPTYQSGGGSGGGYRTNQPARGFQQGGGAGYQGGGYQSYQGSGYQSGGYQSGGYEEGGAFSSYGRRRVGGGGYGQSLSGWTGGYGQQEGSVLWGAGEGYRPYRGRGSSASAGHGYSGGGGGVTANCLRCICNALTGCDPNAGCSNGGCGPFKLSLAYWQDCGSPGQSYDYCASDYSCSSTCVRTYLSKYAQDCNGDGVIDCRDYARIHRLGGFGCRGTLDAAYRGRVDSCRG